jgi:MFS family permease
MLARAIGGVGFNIYGVYVLVYLTNILGANRNQALFALNFATVIFTVCVPIAGWLGDKYGRNRVFMVGALAEGSCAFPVFWMMKSAPMNIWVLCAAIGISFGIMHGIISGLIPCVFSDLFPTTVRYTGISCVYQISTLIFSGSAPIIALFLVRYNNNEPWYLSGYLALIGVVSAAASLWMHKRTPRAPQIVEGHSFNAAACR